MAAPSGNLFCPLYSCHLLTPVYHLQVLFCKNGVLEAMGPGKGFVDMSTIDVETVSDADEVGSIHLSMLPWSCFRSFLSDCLNWSCLLLIYCRLEFICDEIFLRMFKIAKNFNSYIVIIVVMNFRKKFRSQKFSHQVSCYFRKYFPAQNNSSLQ